MNELSTKPARETKVAFRRPPCMLSFIGEDFEALVAGNLVCLEKVRPVVVKRNRRDPRAGAANGAMSAAPRREKPALRPAQIVLLRASFARVERKAGIAGLIFYRNLFTLAPSLRPLFQSDIELQGRKLMEALSFTVQTLEDPAALAPVLEALGRRHVADGARTEYYDTVIEALMRTLQEFLGSDFTQPTSRAWRQALTRVTEIMNRGAGPVVSIKQLSRRDSHRASGGGSKFRRLNQ